MIQNMRLVKKEKYKGSKSMDYSEKFTIPAFCIIKKRKKR